MEIFEICNLRFRYPETDIDILKNINLTINKGEFITVCGPSGCGKTTFLRQLKPSLSPYGKREGKILFSGQNIDFLTQREQTEKIGFVLQSPDNQIVTDKVWHELSFGLESLGFDNQTIRKRVAETASFFGLQNIFDKNITELSGGQKQILNLASVTAMQPEVIILDEPTSQLDPIAASDFLSCLEKINRELGTTVIMTEHRLEDVISMSDRLLVIENGEVVSFDSPENTGENLKKIGSKTFLSMPVPMRIWERVDSDNSKCPINIRQGREWLEKFSENHQFYPLKPENIPRHSEKVVLELKDIYFKYEKNSADIIKNLNFKANEGEFVSILGGNGVGKSTLISLICGINLPYRGKINIFNNTVAAMPQNPQALFSKNTVKEDLCEVLNNLKIDQDEKNKRINSVISLCKLDELLLRHPYDLSGGEQQRAALAKVLLLRPKILLLDEPTKGLDSEFKAVFAKIISSLTKSGATVIMVSHDLEFCAKYSYRCVMMFNGEILSEGTPRKFFSSNSFYSTSANRLSRNILDSAVTDDDVVYCCTGNTENDFQDEIPYTNLYDAVDVSKANEKTEKLPLWKKLSGIIAVIVLVFTGIYNLSFSENSDTRLNFILLTLSVILLALSVGTKAKRFSTPQYLPKEKIKLSKITIASVIISVFAIPLTIFVGVYYLVDQKYLFISLLVMFECMLPFCLVFEGRKPQARELVLIAVLCAIAVAGRFIFFMLPQFKPVAALVIIFGVALGGESGFLIGAITMLVSNIYFQQGPWTPWQMFAMGIIGLLAGVLFKKGLLGRSRTSMCIFGFFATLIIYGGIMNISSAIMAHAQMNFATLISYISVGFPMDLVHAISTVVFLFFASEPMLEKLDRIKTKYGLIRLI